MTTISNITKEFYYDNECVFFKNPTQSAYYVFRGEPLIDLFVNDKMQFVFVFTKESHNRLKLEWRERNNDKTI